MKRSFSSHSPRIRIVYLLIALLAIGPFRPACGTMGFCAQAAERPATWPPKAAHGRLDASSWDFRHGNLALEGEWELYFGQLLEPADFADDREETDAARPPGYVTVPGSWQAAKTEGDPLPRHGLATYRLLVTGLPRSGDSSDIPPWALAIPYARAAYRLWVNGTLVASNGTVSADRDQMRPQYRPLIVRLPETFGSSGLEGAAQLVMQISNAHFRAGGVPKSIVLGPADQVARERNGRLMFQMFLMGAIGLMALYYGMMYAWRPTEPSVLYFALLNGSVAVRTFFTGELPVAFVFPDFPWELQLRIEYVTAYLGPTTFVLFLYSLFPLDASRTARKFWVAVGAVGSIMSLILPVRFSSLSIPYFTALVATLIPYVGFVLVRAAWKKREAAELTLVGGLVFLASVVLTMFHYNQLWINLDWVPVGVFALLVSQALALSRRSALAFQRATELAHQNGLLLEETRQRLSERNHLYRLLTEQDEQTRRGIAELLHGRAQARLFAASQGADQAAAIVTKDPREAVRLMHSVRDIVDQVREEDIRNASHRLHPAAIRASLIGAVDSLCARWPDDVNVDFSVDSQLADLDDPGGPRLKESLRLGLYRIVEEAFNNIHRHAGARHVHVSLGLTPFGGPGTPVASESDLESVLDAAQSGHTALLDVAEPAQRGAIEQGSWIELVVADDGAGFDAENTNPGLGLQLIAARTADLGGRWQIRSEPGHGTKLRVVVPVELR